MADVTQAASTLLSHQLLTNAATAAGLSVVGSEVDVRTFLSATVYVYHAYIEAAANDPGIEYHLQGRWSTGTTVDEDWITLWTFQAGIAAAVAAEISGTEAAGETTIAVDADPTAAFTPGIEVYIEDTGTVANGEWSRVVLSTTAADIVNIVDGLTNAKDSADTIWTQASTFSGSVDLSGISYVRMIVVNRDGSGADVHFKAEMISFTDIE